MKRTDFLASTGALVGIPAVGTASSARKRALVLTGAGALGAYEAGAAIALLRNGERFDYICGTSIGAINGAFLAMGELDRLEQLWKTIGRHALLVPKPRLAALMRSASELSETNRGVISRPYNVLHAAAQFYAGGNVFGETGLFEHEPIARLLRDQIDLRAVKTTFAWSVTNLNDARSEACYVAPPEMPDLQSRPTYRVHRLDPAQPADVALFPEAIRASGAIPIVFDPVALTFRSGERALYVDGGVAQNAPIGIARHVGATDLVGITASPPANRAEIGGMLDILFQSYAANQNRLIFAQLDDGTTGTPLLANALVAPDPPLTLSMLDFDKQDALDAAFSRGRADALRGPVPIVAG